VTEGVRQLGEFDALVSVVVKVGRGYVVVEDVAFVVKCRVGVYFTSANGEYRLDWRSKVYVHRMVV